MKTRRLDPLLDARHGSDRDQMARERRARYLYAKQDWDNLRREYSQTELRVMGFLTRADAGAETAD